MFFFRFMCFIISFCLPVTAVFFLSLLLCAYLFILLSLFTIYIILDYCMRNSRTVLYLCICCLGCVQRHSVYMVLMLWNWDFSNCLFLKDRPILQIVMVVKMWIKLILATFPYVIWYLLCLTFFTNQYWCLFSPYTFIWL